jgi:hypothetical protein
MTQILRLEGTIKMLVKRSAWSFLIVMVLWSTIITSSVSANESSPQSQLLDHVGKSYTGVQDPSYLTYDLALREHVADRIAKRFGVAIDPKIYSGFDLLEIEAFFKCKKSEEPFDIFLKIFPKK